MRKILVARQVSSAVIEFREKLDENIKRAAARSPFLPIAV
jgi:hypothetical protein